MTEASALPDIPGPDLYAQLAAIHGHFCPMSTLGLRLGWAARRRVGSDPRAVVYNIQTCAVEGICLALDVESVTVDRQQQHRLFISDLDVAWQIDLNPEALRLAASYKALASDAEREFLLDKLRSADESCLMDIVQTRITP